MVNWIKCTILSKGSQGRKKIPQTVLQKFCNRNFSFSSFKQKKCHKMQIKVVKNM